MGRRTEHSIEVRIESANGMKNGSKFNIRKIAITN